MEPGSQADTPLKSNADRCANWLGTLIALLTLAIPLAAIAYFSSTRLEPWQPPPYSLLNSREVASGE